MTAAISTTELAQSHRLLRFSARHVPVVATILVWLLLMLAGSVRYTGFLSLQNCIDLLRSNAFLGIAAVGMTFVILSGGIDLSVGAMIGFTSVLIGSLITEHGWPALLAIGTALLIGVLFGAFMGSLIAFVELPPFLVTLAGMFFARGMGFVIRLGTIPIESAFYEAINRFSSNVFPVIALLFLGTLATGIYIAHQTRFGRAIYAIGGNEQSAILMGVPVKWTKVRIYALSGFCAALAGVVFTINTPSGDANAGTMLELDAIAVVVIGGTQLTGGVGYVFGTLMGVLIFSTIQAIVTFEGTLNSWWAKIATYTLLLAFILLQKLVEWRVSRRRRAGA